jgi:hypothetical protein
MLFEKEFLQEMQGETVEDKMVEHKRWSIVHVRVFGHEGKFYRTRYAVGATESQDESPYENDPDQIECPEVHPVQKTITVYE